MVPWQILIFCGSWVLWVSSFPSICLIYSQQHSGFVFDKLQDVNVEYLMSSVGAVLWIWVALLHEKALQGLRGEKEPLVVSLYLKKLLPVTEIFLKLHLALFLSLISFICSYFLCNFLLSRGLWKTPRYLRKGFFYGHWNFPCWLLLNKKKYGGHAGVIVNWGNCFAFCTVSPPYIKWIFWDKMKSRSLL